MASESKMIWKKLSTVYLKQKWWIWANFTKVLWANSWNLVKALFLFLFFYFKYIYLFIFVVFIIIMLQSGHQFAQVKTAPLSWHMNGSVQKRCNSIANTLELRLSSTNPSICKCVTWSDGQFPSNSNKNFKKIWIMAHYEPLSKFCKKSCCYYIMKWSSEVMTSAQLRECQILSAGPDSPCSGGQGGSSKLLLIGMCGGFHHIKAISNSSVSSQYTALMRGWTLSDIGYRLICLP